MTRATLILAGLITAAAAAQDSTVSLRGGEPSLTGVLQQADADALVLNAGAVRWRIGWNRVAAVRGNDLDPALLDLADRSWRGCSRAERGDYLAAEPLLEALLDSYHGRTGPTAADVSLALLRCRLNRGAYVQAVPAMLVHAGAVSAGREGWFEPASRREPRQDELPDAQVWDDALGLCPSLPPMWIDAPATQALARRDWPRHAGRAETLSALYAASLRFEAGLDPSLPARPAIDDGASLVFDVVAARTGDAATRAAARASLVMRSKKTPPEWVEVWCRAALGRSLVMEPDAESRLLGVAELLRVPALHERFNPYVSGLCLAEAAVALDRLGEPDAAASLRTELAERFPEHPALAWEVLERVGPRSKPRSRPADAAPAEGSPKPDEPSPSTGGPP